MRRCLVLLALACVLTLATMPAHGQEGAPGSGIALGADPYAGPAPPQRRGNPLWAIPLRELFATRERPLFSPTRRPPPQAITQAPPPAPPAAATPAVPPFILIGTLVNERGGFALFLDPASRTVIRLRTGEAHAGWILRSVSMRDAMLQKDRSTTVMTLPAREAEGGATRAARTPRAGGNATVEINLPKGAEDAPVDPFTEE